MYGRNYAVVAPVFSGTDGNMSYLRLSNDGSTSSSFIINFVGSTSGNVYGTATIKVPAAASPQYAIADLLNLAKAGPLSGGDTAYALYLQDADQVGFQHVLYNGASGFFENASVCEYDLPPSAQPVLHNVHTSRLASYPSQIVLHNYYNAALTYRIKMIDAANGTLIGTVPLQAAANSSYTVTEASLEQQLGWAPNDNQPHVNVVFTADGVANAPAVVSNFIYNQRLNAYVNMSGMCAVNDSGTNCISDPNGLTHGCVKGSNIAGGSFGASVFTLSIAAGSGSVSLSPQQITCQGTCSILLPAGTSTTLTAIANGGAAFLGWTGACANQDACTVTMNSNQSVLATFSASGF